MFRHFIVLSSLLALLGCANNLRPPYQREANKTLVTLSHVKAYLLLNNTTKAEERFQTIQSPELLPEAMLVLAQLRAVNGDNLGAQQAFILALDSQPSLSPRVPLKLLDYLCQQKAWQGLERYGNGLLEFSKDINKNNASSSRIGQCFYKAQIWEKAKHWLSQLDLTHPVNPIDFLVLARLGIEDKQYQKAEKFIIRFEETKDKVDAYILWTTFEVYQGLKQKKRAELIGTHLSALFPDSDYNLVYREMLKRPSKNTRKNLKVEIPHKAEFIHIMKKNETLYQLSKRYAVSITNLLKWNPDLIVDNIAVGTVITITENQTK